ncbi:hypothetical protein AB0C34_15400 [Nocardia sp. NPDC049220]|uniref:hypothetical protein n=1 Tax=Nocardia sp. NPDC049220 TaxID=3155273 RepID=UPI0033C97FD1
MSSADAYLDDVENVATITNGAARMRAGVGGRELGEDSFFGRRAETVPRSTRQKGG